MAMMKMRLLVALGLVVCCTYAQAQSPRPPRPPGGRGPGRGGGGVFGGFFPPRRPRDFNGTTWRDQRRLRSRLMSASDRAQAPSMDPVPVTLYMTETKLQDVNEKDHTLYFSAKTNVSWVDPRMTWQPSSYRGIERIRLRSTRLWIPDIQLKDGLVKEVHEDMVMVHPEGDVHRIQVLEFTMHCALNPSDFPYDSQLCILRFFTTIFPVRFQYTGQFHGPGNASIKSLPNWKMVEFVGITDIDEDAAGGADMLYHLIIQRQGSSLLYTMVAPIVLCCLFAPFILLIGSRNTQRLILGGCLLVCEFVSMGILQFTIPIGGASAPRIVQYHLFVLVFTFIIMVLATITSNMAARTGPRSCLTSSACMDWLAKILCVPHGSYSTFDNPESNANDHKMETRISSDVSVISSSDTTSITTKSRSGEICGWAIMADIIDRILFIIATVIVIIVSAAMIPKSYYTIH